MMPSLLRRALRPALLLSLLALAGCAPAERGDQPLQWPAPALAGSAPHGAGRLAVTRLHLAPDGPGLRDFYVAGWPGDRIRVALISAHSAPQGVVARCDGRARLVATGRAPQRPGAAAPAFAAAGTPLGTQLPAGARSGYWLDLAQETTSCQLEIQPFGAAAYRVDLAREREARPEVARLDAAGLARLACPAPRAGDPLTAAFWAVRPLSQTCPSSPGTLRFLQDPLEAFDAKVEALTGQRLGRAALQSGSPDLPIDFSQAPELELITVSYLNFNADFTGQILARILAFHAERGTVVRILVADPMWGEIERGYFEPLAARYPTIQIQPFRFETAGFEGPEEHIGRLHRVQHIKLFAVVARDPARSRAMIGGRNLHDGYVVATPFDLGRWPQLRQYDPGRAVFSGGFHSYEDFEIEFRSDAQVRLLSAHLATIWHRDHASQRPARPAAAPSLGTPPREGPLMRHYLSVPWADGRAQERLYADLIDAARHRIDISSPYLNPPPLVAEALERALARGVQVRIVTTERVREAGDAFITGLNRLFAQMQDVRAGNARRSGPNSGLSYLDYDPHPRLLHSKLMVIDDRLALVGSTNLNMRSFVHDLENGVIFLDPALARRLRGVIDGYAAEARPISPDAEVSPLVRSLLRLPWVRRVF